MPSVDDRVARLTETTRARLSSDATPESLELIDQKLQLVAAELALEWISGVRRFENQSQMTEHWLGRLYDELFPTEQPDAGRIYTRFDFPLPRAQYVARLLMNRNSAHWREQAVREAQKTLQGREAVALDAIKHKRGDTEQFELSMTRGAFESLVVAYDRVASKQPANQRVAAPRRKAASGSLVWFSISADAIVAILAELSTSSGAQT